MQTALLCLLGFALWTVLVLLSVGGYRVSQVLMGKARPNQFPGDRPHGPEVYQRLMRAHMNCVENLPVFAGVVLTGAVSGYDAPSFGTLATVILAARVGQTVAHVSSGRSRVINIRFTFFAVQIVSLLVMLFGIVGHLRAGG